MVMRYAQLQRLNLAVLSQAPRIPGNQKTAMMKLKVPSLNLDKLLAYEFLKYINCNNYLLSYFLLGPRWLI